MLRYPVPLLHKGHESKSGWMKNEYDWYLLNPSGALQTKNFTYKDKKFSFNEDGEMVKGWIVLESLVKKVYPEPDLKHVLRAKRVQSGEIIEVTGKIGPWYEVNYHGEKGYVRIHDAIIFDQEAKNPLTLLDGKLKIFEGVFNYLKSDETLVNDTFKVLEDLDHNTTDSIENWNNISKEIDNAKQDVQYKIVVVKEARDKMQELVNALKGDIKNLTVTQRQMLLSLIGEDKEKLKLFGKDAITSGKELIDFNMEILKQYQYLLEYEVDSLKAISAAQDEINMYLKSIADYMAELAASWTHTAEVLRKNGTFEDLGKVAESSIRLKKSIEVAKPKMEELARKTQETVPVIAGHLQTLQEKVPGFYTDVNTGLDFANVFMDSANKIASHKVDIPAAARNIGNIDLSNALRDLGANPTNIYDSSKDQDLSFMLDITPGIGTGKEIGQLIKGKDLVTKEEYGPSDYGWGTLSVVSGGTSRVVGKVVGKIGDLEKKAKNLEKATQGTSGIGWSMPRGGGVINGRKYSEHALERMAPKTPEVKAELTNRAHERAAKQGLKPGTKEYNEVLKKYIDPRGITPVVVEDIIKNGSRKPGNKPGSWEYTGKDARVILNDNGDVVSVIPYS